MDREAIQRVRSFNRTVTQRIGALDDQFLGRGRSIGESRLLWEIGLEGSEVRSLRSRLGLDSGHVSRLLRSLETAGLVRVEASPADGRIRVVTLTRAGIAERKVLDRRNEVLAASLLAPLNRARREELLAAMKTVDRLLSIAIVEVHEVDPNHPDARRCVRAYLAELDRRSDEGFDPAIGISAEPHELVAPVGCFLVAYQHGEPVGCGAAKHHPGEPSEIKRMWVTEAARGHGVARRILTELERRIISSGASVARLETNGALVEAIAMYRSAGYDEVPAFNDEPFAHHWFEKQLA